MNAREPECGSETRPHLWEVAARVPLTPDVDDCCTVCGVRYGDAGLAHHWVEPAL